MNFDLTTDNYSRDELIEMFELPSNYNTNILETKAEQLINSIHKNREITSETQQKMISFLVKAKNLLLNKVTEFIHNSYSDEFNLKPIALEDPEEHMVQDRTKVPYLTSFPTEYVSGAINPIKKRTIKKSLSIDSRFRENYFASLSSDYSITLPTTFNDVLTMNLSSIELPTTYYVVSKQFNNNYFFITVNAGETNSEIQKLEINEGNYTFEGMLSILNETVNNLGGDFTNLVFLLNNTSNNGSGQIMVGIKDGVTEFPFTLNFQLDRFGNDDKNTPLPLKLGWILGFRNGVYENNYNYVSEGILDITGPRYMYLVVDDFNNNVNNGFYSAFNSSLLNKNILARISMQQPNKFNVLLQNNNNIITVPREYFGPVNIQNLHIQLLDEYGRVVFLNNMDFSFCLTLTTVYDI